METRASELLKCTAWAIFKPGMLKLKPSAGRLTLSALSRKAAVDLRQDVAQLLEARSLGLGRSLTAEDDPEVVLETAVDRVLDAEIENAGRQLGGGNAAGEWTLSSRGEQLVERLGNIERRWAAAQLLGGGGNRQKREQQPAVNLSNLHD